MTNDNFSILLDCLRIVENPNNEQQAKAKAIKNLICKMIDMNMAYGNITKQDLKHLVDISNTAKELYEVASVYFASHDIRL